jgi:glycogen synthase kinase 3 beta
MFQCQPTAPVYTPISFVGEGSFGVVMQARDTKGNVVAIKKVKKSERYESREMHILQLLNKIPYCIKLLNAFHTIDSEKRVLQNLVFEYLPTSLEKYLGQHVDEKRYIDYIKIQNIIRQLLLGLKEMHALGICHRDLKPDNILMDEDYNIKICDFGSSKILKESEQNITRIVARCYRPPEIAFAHRDYTTAVDMWTVGCIIFELMSLQPAFEASSDGMIFFEHHQLIGNPTQEECDYLFKSVSDGVARDLGAFLKSNKVHRVKISGIHPTIYSEKEREDAGYLIENLLKWKADERFTAEECLKQAFSK